MQGASPENRRWWSEREGKSFIRRLRVKFYQRVQARIHHVQPPGYYGDLMRLYEDARRSPCIPYVRINDYPWNKRYPPGTLPRLIEGRLKDHPHIFEKWETRLHEDIRRMERKGRAR